MIGLIRFLKYEKQLTSPKKTSRITSERGSNKENQLLKTKFIIQFNVECSQLLARYIFFGARRLDCLFVCEPYNAPDKCPCENVQHFARLCCMSFEIPQFFSRFFLLSLTSLFLRALATILCQCRCFARFVTVESFSLGRVKDDKKTHLNEARRNVSSARKLIFMLFRVLVSRANDNEHRFWVKRWKKRVVELVEFVEWERRKSFRIGKRARRRAF